jgi:hypothetical protein
MVYSLAVTMPYLKPSGNEIVWAPIALRCFLHALHSAATPCCANNSVIVRPLVGRPASPSQTTSAHLHATFVYPSQPQELV